MQPDDFERIERIKNQDQRALTELYDSCGRLVYNMAMQVLRSEAAAEEITQDVFLQIWHKPESWNPEKGPLSSWLLAAARYRAIDRLRHDQHRPARASISLDDLGHLMNSRGPASESHHDTSRVLRAFVKSLPEDHQQVINLVFFRGMTHTEIAQHLQLPVEVVKGQIRQALEKLREVWLAQA